MTFPRARVAACRLSLAALALLCAAGSVFAAGIGRGKVVYEVLPSSGGPSIRETSAPDVVPPLPRDVLAVWVEKAARSVTAYFGRFPSPVRLYVESAGDGRIGNGVTRRGRPPTIRFSLGTATTAADLEADWVLTHEMVHLAFPTVRSQPWLEEGVAVYVEPIARAKAGTASSRNVWEWLVWGLPKGLPAGQDHGLDSGDSWGRRYWGGALFCFLADVEIRRATDNRHSLGDALRAILDRLGGVSGSATIDEVIAAGDGAVERPVLRELYDRLGKEPGTVDLAALFRVLGVSGRGDGLRFDDDAPYASIRRALPMDATLGASSAARARLEASRGKP